MKIVSKALFKCCFGNRSHYFFYFSCEKQASSNLIPARQTALHLAPSGRKTSNRIFIMANKQNGQDVLFCYYQLSVC